MGDYPTNNDNYWYGSSYVYRPESPAPPLPTPVSNARVGRSDVLTPSWLCSSSEHEMGYAYGDLQSRWDLNPGNYPLLKNLLSVCSNTASGGTDSRNFYLTYNVRITNISSGTALTDPLFCVRVTGTACPSSGWVANAVYVADEVTVPILGNPTPIVLGDGMFTLADFLAIGSPSIDFKVMARVSYQTLITHNIMVDYTVSNLSPRMFWYDNCDLRLASIEIEDQMHRDMSTDNAFRVEIVNRANHISRLALNVVGIYTHDEPTQAQFSSFQTLHSWVAGGTNRPMTAVNLRGYDDFVKTDGTPYNHVSSFFSVKPRTLMPEAYPIIEGIEWNDSTSDLFLQRRISKLLSNVYKAAKDSVMANPLLDCKLYPIVQSFGRFKAASGPNPWSWDEFVLPPYETQKMLQYFPLCYGVDGIYNYRLFGYLTEANHTEYAALTKQTFAGAPQIADPPITYNALLEANCKINFYGDTLQGLTWEGAFTSKEDYDGSDYDAMARVLLNSISDIDNNQYGAYGCYVECGLYNDNSTKPYIMLVNRRANFYEPHGTPMSSNQVMPIDYDVYFPHFDNQIIAAEPNPQAYQTFGTYVSLFDDYDDKLYLGDGETIPIEMQPGDGILLQMCSSLPEIVNSNAVLKSKAFLTGSITIDNGAGVSIGFDAETTILPHTVLRVKGGSSLSISGTVTIGDSVAVIVEEGSSIIFKHADCTWGIGAKLQINGSIAYADSSSFVNSSYSPTWGGIYASNSSEITLNNTLISGAEANELKDSDVWINNSRFNIPGDAVGLYIENSNSDYTVKIEANVEDKGFFGDGITSVGLVYKNVGTATIIRNLDFSNLGLGLNNLHDSAVRDSITSCTFVGNSTGIHLYGPKYSPFISDCTFSRNEIGAILEAASPELRDCLFDQCELGILTELSTGSTGGIYDCIFQSGETAIVSRGSNLRVAGNLFYTEYGILNHSGSILNMGKSAKNLFNAELVNLKFEDTISYNARVQLYMGHNDFYHYNPGLLIPTHDFHFDSNWYVSPPPRSNAIDARYNWFEDGSVQISCPGLASNYVSCSVLDPSPNVELEGSDRMAQALSSENLGDYPGANSSYKSILNEDLVTESELLYDAMDGYYRTSDPADELPSAVESYLLAKISQYDTENPILVKYAQDYLVKSYLKAKAYQTAIDLIQGRIDNPESAVDSLLAVMDLEIVLQLAAMDEAKKPITTKYMQFVYPNRQVFVTKHAEHWDKLNRLLDNEGEEIMPIPAKAVIGSNYPNPFNPSTTISFSIPKDSLVKLSVFNLRGQKIKDLLDEDMLRGHHKIVWDGKDKNNRMVSSGLYFLKLEAAGNISTQKVMLMK